MTSPDPAVPVAAGTRDGRSRRAAGPRGVVAAWGPGGSEGRAAARITAAAWLASFPAVSTTASPVISTLLSLLTVTPALTRQGAMPR